MQGIFDSMLVDSIDDLRTKVRAPELALNQVLVLRRRKTPLVHRYAERVLQNEWCLNE